MEFGNRLRDDAPPKQPIVEKEPAPGQPGAPSRLRAEWHGSRKTIRTLAGFGYAAILLVCLLLLSGLWVLKDDALELAGQPYTAVSRADLPFSVPDDRAVFDAGHSRDDDRLSLADQSLLRTCMPTANRTRRMGDGEVSFAVDGRLFERGRAVRRGRYLVFGLDEADAFLACAAARQKQRFCDDHYRKRFAARLKELVSLRRLAAAATNAGGRTETEPTPLNLSPAVGQRLPQSGAAQTSSAGRSRRIGATGSVAASPRHISQALGNAIYRLSRNGFLSAADFGTLFVGPPEPIALFMRSARRTPACRIKRR